MQYLPASPYVRHGSGNSEEGFPAPAAYQGEAPAGRPTAQTPISALTYCLLVLMGCQHVGYPFALDHGLVPASNFYFLPQPSYLSHPLPLAQGDPLGRNCL